MRLSLFGRKTSQAAAGVDGDHSSVLARLAEEDKKDPVVRLRLAGQVLFSGVCRMVTTEKGVRIEDVLGILGATGGFACIVGALATAENEPGDAIAVATTADGRKFYFGDRPNKLLLEDRLSLLSLTVGAALQHDSSIATDMIIDVVKHVAATIGTPSFGIPRLPREHRPGDVPYNCVKHLWPKVRGGLDLYEVSPAKYATSVGFAIQEAIAKGIAVLSPRLAVQIVAEYAVPMARLDPAEFEF